MADIRLSPCFTASLVYGRCMDIEALLSNLRGVRTTGLWHISWLKRIVAMT